MAHFDRHEVLSAGFDPAGLKLVGFSAEEVKSVGYTLRSMKNGGYNLIQLRKAGYSCGSLKAAGFLDFLVDALKEYRKHHPHRTPEEQLEHLKEAGFSAVDFKKAG